MADSERTLEIQLKMKDLASAELKRFQDATKQTGKSITDTLKSFAGLVGVPLAIGAITLALRNSLKGTLDWSESIEKLSMKLGATTDQVQTFEYAAKLTHTSAEGLGSIIGFLANKIDDIRDKVPGASDGFYKLGINIKGMIADDATAVDVFYAMSNRLREIQDPLKRISGLRDVFGRGGTEYLSLFLLDLEKIDRELPKISKEGIESLQRMEKASVGFWHNMGLLPKAFWAGMGTAYEKLTMQDKAFQNLVATSEKYNNVTTETLNLSLAQITGYKYNEYELKAVAKILDTLTGKFNAVAKAGSSAGGQMKVMTEIDRDLRYITDTYSGSLEKQIEVMASYRSGLKDGIDGIDKIDESLCKLKKQLEIRRETELFQKSFSDLTFTTGGNIKMLIEGLEKMKVAYAGNDAIISQVNLKIDELKNKSRGFGESWSATMNYATDTTVNWFEAMKGGIDAFTNMFSDSFYQMTQGTFHTKEAFKKFSQDIFKIISDLMAKRVVASFFSMFATGGGGGITTAGEGTAVAEGTAFAAKGGVFGKLNIPHFSNGGIVNRSTMAMIGEGSNREAVVPLPDNKSIPVKMIGGDGGKTVNIGFTILANDSRGFAELLIKNKQVIIDAVGEGMRTNRDFRKTITATA